MRSGSEVILEALQQAGVDLVFGYPGGAIMPLYDAIVDAPIRHVLTRHEQSAIHAADGYARSRGRLGVCLATSGPGATNLVTGLSTAMMDSSPVLCLTGQVPAPLIGTDAFQEADVFGIVTTVTKQAYLVRSADELPETMAEAIFVASSGRPGPVLVDVAKTAFLEQTPRTCEVPTGLPGYEPSPRHAIDALRSAHTLLQRSARPICMVGGGCRSTRAVELFRHWCALTEVPVITTLMGLGACDPDYAGWLGMPGMHGLRRANRAITECDLIVAMGMRFDDRVTANLERFAPNARVIHVDIDEAELNKLVSLDVAIHGSLEDVLADWIVMLKSDRLAPRAAWQRQAYDVGSGLTRATQRPPGSVCPIGLLDEVLALAGGSTFVTTDVGQHQMWVAQRVRPDEPCRWLTSGGAGTMGFGLPSAMGVQMAFPDEKVLAVVGDGGFQMTMNELATIRRCDLPVKILVMDNKYLGMVRQWQELFFEQRYSAVDMSDNPDFAELGRVYGIDAFTLTHADAQTRTLQAWWSVPGPALLHAVCSLEENVYPMVPAGAGLDDMVESNP